MTKRLILTRHAKSSWDDPLTPDHDRPLNERGKAAAADLGDWLASRGYVPDEVLCSDALRTRKTWSGIAPALPGTPILELKPALYHAGPDVMLAVLRHATGETVMMIGHNPGIAEFAHRLVARAPLHARLRTIPDRRDAGCGIRDRPVGGCRLRHRGHARLHGAPRTRRLDFLFTNIPRGSGGAKPPARRAGFSGRGSG